jgi:ligand-binding sensor domain-containing protein
MKPLLLLALGAVSTLAADPALKMPQFRWESFTAASGLPSDRVFNVCVEGDRVWAGTDNGLAVYQNGRWTVYTPKDGLAHRVVLQVTIDKGSGDVWIGTMGGLSRFSAGRFVNYTQLNSGLPNDVVYGVAVQGSYVWTATAAGGARLNTTTDQWELFNERNTPMFEAWTYAVSAGSKRAFLAVWGGGVVEYDTGTGRWTSYSDPDGEAEVVVSKDQGLIHDVTTSVSWVEAEQTLWVATYFGGSRYDGRKWTNFLVKDSGLPSNFLNQVKAVDGKRAWFSTDKGLAYYDGAKWAVYRPALDTHNPEMLVRDESGKVTRAPAETAPAHNYIFGVDFQRDDIWVATAKGLSHGFRIP